MFLQFNYTKYIRIQKITILLKLKFFFFFAKQIMNLYYIFQYLAQKKILLLLSMYFVFIYLSI